MRGPRAGAPMRLAWIQKEATIVRRVRENAVRAIDITELNTEILDERLASIDTQAWVGAQHVTRIGLHGGQPRDRHALTFVAGQESCRGVAVDDEGELPGKVVCVLNTGVAAEPSSGRHHVRGIARIEDAIRLQ